MDFIFDPIRDAILRYITEAVLWVGDFISAGLLYTGVEYLRSESFMRLYGIALSITELSLIAVIAYFAFTLSMGKKEIREVMQLLPKLLVSIVASRSMPTIAYYVLKFFNDLARNILTLRAEVAEYTHINGIVFVIFLGIYLYMAYRLIFYFAYRNFAVLMLVSFAPVLLTAWACSYEHTFRMAYGKLRGMLLSQTIHACQLVVLSYVTVGIGEYASGFEAVMLQIGAIALMLEVPSWFDGFNPAMPETTFIKSQGKKAWGGVKDIGKTLIATRKKFTRL